MVIYFTFSTTIWNCFYVSTATHSAFKWLISLFLHCHRDILPVRVRVTLQIEKIGRKNYSYSIVLKTFSALFKFSFRCALCNFCQIFDGFLSNKEFNTYSVACAQERPSAPNVGKSRFIPPPVAGIWGDILKL